MVTNKPSKKTNRGNDIIIFKSLAIVLLCCTLLFLHSLSAQEGADKDDPKAGQVLASILRTAPTGIGIVENRVITMVNDYILALTGYSREELIGKNTRMLYPTQEEFDYVGTEKYRQISQTGTGTLETRWQRKDGTICNIILSSIPLNPNDLSAGVTFTAIDITARKKTEEALRESQEMFSKIFQSNPAPLVLSEIATGKFIDVNNSWNKMLGYISEEQIGRTSTQLGIWTDPKDRDRNVAKIGEQGFFKDEPIQFITRTGEFRYAKWSAEVITIDGQDLLLSLILDETETIIAEMALAKRTKIFLISIGIFIIVLLSLVASLIIALRQRKAAAAVIQHQKERFEYILDGIEAGTWEWNVQTGETIFNEQYAKIAGYTLEELSPTSIQTWMDIAHPDDLQASNNELEAHFSGEKKAYELECRVKHKDGHWIWVLNRGKVISRTEDGQPLWVCGTHQDISERKNADEELLESRENLATTLLSIGDGVIATNEKGEVTNMNSVAEKLCGWKLSDAMGKPLTQVFFIISSVTREPSEDPVKKVLETGEIVGLANHTVLISKDGAEYQIADSAAPIRSREGTIKGVVLVFSDVTEDYAVAEKLRQSEARFQSFMDETPVYAYIKDDALFPIYRNKKVEELLGPANSRKNKDSAYSTFPHLIAKITDNADLEILEGRSQRLTLEYPIKLNGEERWLNDIKFGLKLSDGRKAVGGLAFDITDRKKAEDDLRQSEEKYRLIFEKSPLGVLHCDKNGIINECNMPLAKILDSSRENIIGLNLSQLPDPAFSEALKTVLNGKPAYFDGTIQPHPDKKGTPLRILFSPVMNNKGKIQGAIGLAEDRSLHIQGEEFKKQAEIAKESVKFKQNFLANMSHEIRTPLTGVLGMVDILEQTQLSENQKEYINILKLSGENLKEIINQVLDYSKIEAGKVTIKPTVFSFNTLLNDAETLYKNIAKPGVTFSSHVDPQVPSVIIADKIRIAQIINNLVSNALKFTNQGSVRLNTLLVGSPDNSHKVEIKIEVTDTGIGIRGQMQQKLFTPFSQVDNNDTRFYEGTGLGLSICKELVSLLGGEIGVVSKYGTGSTFWFTFVAEVPNVNQQSVVSEKPLPLNKKLRILFAEDKVVNQKVVSIMLTSMGYEVIIAKNGEQALKLYKQGKFDLILMDIQMPVMDGITATQKLKQKHKNLPPIIGLSANAFEGDREKYMELGMDEYLTKPVKKDDFIQLLSKVFAES